MDIVWLPRITRSWAASSTWARKALAGLWIVVWPWPWPTWISPKTGMYWEAKVETVRAGLWYLAERAFLHRYVDWKHIIFGFYYHNFWSILKCLKDHIRFRQTDRWGRLRNDSLSIEGFITLLFTCQFMNKNSWSAVSKQRSVSHSYNLISRHCGGNLDSVFSREGELFNSASLHSPSPLPSFPFSMLTRLKSEVNMVTCELLLNSSKPIKQHVMWLIEPFHLEVARGRDQ